MDLVAAHLAAERLMMGHGLIALGWEFRFDSARLRFGICRHGSKVIGLSRHLTELNDEAQVLDTIKHEIAHALVGPGHGHNGVWKRKAVEVGAKPERCYPKGVAKPKGKYEGECSSCGRKFTRYKGFKAANLLAGYYHKPCNRARKPGRGNIVWSQNGKPLVREFTYGHKSVVIAPVSALAASTAAPQMGKQVAF